MGSFRLGGMTFGSLFKKPETVLYPLETKPAPAGLKGHVVNEVELCILCGICQKGCPADAITVEKKERLWAIDPFRCVQCGACVRACPKDCLIMDAASTAITVEKYRTERTVPDPKAVTEAVVAEG